MSDNAGFLSWASSTISSQSADIEKKIERLQIAKNDLIEEQAVCMHELQKIRKPSLAPLWDGAKGKEYDEMREEAHAVMKSIYTYDYDAKISMIETHINSLNFQKSSLAVTSNLVSAANGLLSMGEDALQELSSKINAIRGRLFG